MEFCLQASKTSPIRRNAVRANDYSPLQTAVKKLYIGFGSRAASKAAGNGTVYLDDIRVVK